MRKLNLKLVRDVKTGKAQFAAVSLIVFFGVASFLGTYAAYLNLDASYNASFQELRMADYWISVAEVEQKAVRDMEKIEGVTAQGRIVDEVGIELGGTIGERIEGRVISLPRYMHPKINDVLVKSGNYFSPNFAREILLNKHFADYHGLGPGDWVTLKLGNNSLRFRIAGVVVSPEYIWVSKSMQEPMPTPRTFGVLFMAHPAAETLFDMAGRVNEINLLVSPGTDHEQVLGRVRGVLRDYGIDRLSSKDSPVPVAIQKMDIIEGVRTAHMIARKDQPSNRLLKMDLEGFRELAFLFPLLFLSMASATIYVLLNRMVESHQVPIGLMRAMGYRKRSILFHYLSFALAVGIAGALLGLGLGIVLSRLFTVEYVSLLNVPFTVIGLQPQLMLVAVFIGILVPLVSGVIPSSGVLKIRPAEAMRPARPGAGRRSLLEVILPFMKKLPYFLKLPLRNISRNIKRTAFMTIGVASAVVLILVSLSFVDAINSSLFQQFRRVQAYDARIIYQDRGSATVASYVANLGGIRTAEPVLEMPYRLRFQDNVSDSSVMGLSPDSGLYRLFDPEGEPVKVPEDGILLSQSLRNKVKAEVGDKVRLIPKTGAIGEVEKELKGFVDEPLGGRAFMNIEEAQEMLHAPGTATGIFLAFDGEPSDRLLERLYNLPQTASLEYSGETEQAMQELMGFFWVFVGVMIAMGAALGAAIVFNGVTVNMLERRREIAIMRAIGMSKRALGFILTVENILLGLLGVLIGLPIGRAIASYFMSTYDTDVFSMSLVILPRSYAIAAGTAFLILLLSQWPSIRGIFRMRLSTATKDWSE